jgi:hypothetical protein
LRKRRDGVDLMVELQVAQTMFRIGQLTPDQYVRVLLAAEPEIERRHRESMANVVNCGMRRQQRP